MGWRAISDHVDENNTLRMAEQQERKCLGPQNRTVTHQSWSTYFWLKPQPGEPLALKQLISRVPRLLQLMLGQVVLLLPLPPLTKYLHILEASKSKLWQVKR